MKRNRPSERLNRWRGKELDGLSVPHYPDIRVSTESSNSWVLVARVRQALRRKRAPQSEIDRFTAQALKNDDPSWQTRVCQDWVIVA